MGVLTIQLGSASSQSTFPISVGRNIPVNHCRLVGYSIRRSGTATDGVLVDIPWLTSSSSTIVCGTESNNPRSLLYFPIANGVGNVSVQSQSISFGQMSETMIPAVFSVTCSNPDGTPCTNITHMSIQIEFHQTRLI